jgi:hypothetical protein
MLKRNAGQNIRIMGLTLVKWTRRFSVSSLAQVPQLPKTFCGNEGDLECSGLTELGMGIERVDGKIQSGVQPPQSKKPGSGLNFWKMFAVTGAKIEATLGGLTQVSVGPGERARDPLYG